MNSLNIFYRTSTEGGRAQIDSLKKAGDFCLTPVRYFFRGRNVEFVKGFGDKTIVIDSADYAANNKNKFRVGTIEKNWMRTCLCIIGFIPGLILGSILKGLSYLNKSIRDEHNLIKLHFEREFRLLINNSHFYSKYQPNGVSIAIQETSYRTKANLENIRLNQKVNVLEIDLEFAKEEILENSISSRIKLLDPLKLILHTKVFVENTDPWAMAITGKWLTEGEGDEKKLVQKRVSSVTEALTDRVPLRPNTTKPYKCVYLIQP